MSDRLDANDRPDPAATGLDGLLDALPAGVVLLDGDRRIRWLNRSARELGVGLLPDGDWPGLVQRVVAPGPGASGELRLADGRRLRVAERLLDDAGGSVLLLTDITSQGKLEDVLARHRRLAALGEMAATLAHQIRTPLSAALLYASNAASPAVAPAHRDSMLGKAMDCLQDLEQLVSDMLGFARGAATPDASLDLPDILAAVEQSARPLLRPGQSLRVAEPVPAARLAGNRETLVGAILNLVTNALQAAGPAACVSVSAARQGTLMELRVSDNGPGVPPSLRERIFEPFFTARSDGTGLGLAVVRSVAEAHGGSVQVEDCAPGGACFVLRIPLGREGLLPQPIARETAAA